MKTKILTFFAAFFLIAIPFSQANNGFIPNQGQIIDETGTVRPDVLFTYELPGAKMFFMKDRIVFAFWNIEYVENEKSRELYEKGDIEGAKFHSMRIHQMRIDMEFEGTNANGDISYDKQFSNYVNFYLGHCPEGIRNVGVYQKVTYHNVWNNIDLVFLSNETGLKYDLVLRPGARLSDIKFRYRGIEKLSLTDGSLNVENVFVPLTEHIPLSYFSETNQEIKVHFKIIDESSFGFYSDELTDDIIEQEVIIDPTLSWSTYFERTVAGGVSTIRGNNTTDSDGNFFYQINTYTADLPIANPGAPVYLDPSYNPSSGLDIYFAKFDINRELIWSTYLGGTSGNQSNYYDHGLATWNGCFFICGNTNSNNFPLVNQGGGAYYQTYPGSTCGFLSKFDATTGQMIHSTYLRSYDYHSMAVDNLGNIAVMSFNYTWSVSPNIMNRAGAYNQAAHGGDSDLFIYMFNSSLQQTWGTYFGGAGYTDPHGITFDSNRNLFVFSRSDNNTGMPLLNPGGGAFYQSTVNGKFDCGISKFNTSGALVWSTYYGGAGLEGLSYSKALVNENNDIILTTTTRSTVMPVFNQGGGAYYQGTPPVGLNDGWGSDPGAGFYIRFNNNGVRQHATYIGVDNESNYIHDQAQGNCGRQYMILSTKAFPVTVLSGAYNQTNAFPSTYSYMALEFNSSFAIRWASYLQRDSTFFEQFAIDKQNGRLYVTGLTQATDYITANPGGGAFYDGVKNMAAPTSYTGAIMEFDIGAPPTVWVSGGGNPEVCSGGSITLNASGSGTIYWYDQQTGGTQLGTGTSFTLNNVTTTTTVWVESNDGGCESARTPITITVLSAPSVTLSASPNPICQGASVTLTAGGASSYSWSGGLGTGTTKNVTPGSTTTYTVTGTGSNTCTATASVTVTVNANPTVTLSPSAAAICNGSSTTLTAGGASSYSWSSGLGTGNPKVVSPSSNTTYTVTGTAANGCSATASTTITVNANPSVTLTPSATIVCSGSPVTLTGGGATNYSWSGGLGTGNPKVVNPTSNTTYTVTGTDGNGCSASASTTISVNANPVVGITPTSTTICNGQSVTLTGTGASNYSWSSGLGTGNPKVVSPSSNTTYTVTGTDANNCSATAGVTITVNANPTVTLTPSASSICNGSSTTLTAGGASSYSWSGGLGTGNPKVVSPSSNTTYTVTGTAANGCSATASTTITVNANPSVTLTPSATIVCSGSPVTLTGGGATNYSWSGGLGTGNPKVVNPTSNTTYTVTGTDGNGCSASASTTISVNANPVVGISPTSTSICNGQSVTLTGTGASNYSWSSGLGTGNPKVVSPSSNTTYTVTGTDANNCSATAGVTINVNPNPTVTLTPSVAAVCSGSPVTLTGGGATNYSWSGGLGTGNPKVVNPTTGTTYIVTGTDGNNCSASASVFITVHANPSITLNASSTGICEGESVTLTAGGGSSYVWSPSGSGSSFNATPSSNTTWSVTGTDGNGCSNTAQVTVSVSSSFDASITPVAPMCYGTAAFNLSSTDPGGVWSGPGITNTSTGLFSSTVAGPGTHIITYGIAGACGDTGSVSITIYALPSVTLVASSASICEGEQVTLTAGGAANYTWSPSGSGSSFNATPTSNTTWSVTGTDGNNCSNTAQVSVNVSESFNATIDPVTSMCLNASPFNLNATDPGGVWSGPGITNSSTGLFNPSVAGSGTHTITYGIAGTCGDTGTVQITVFALPAVTLNASSTNICEGEQVTLTAGGAANYTWSPSGSGNSVIETPSTTTTWYITGTDANNCSNTAQITVNVSSAFDATITPVGSVCSNDPAFNLTAANGGGVWSGAGITNTSTGLFNPTFAGAGNHEIIYTIYGSCGDADTITVTVLQAPTVTLIADNSSICAGEQVSLTAGGADTYVWVPSGSGNFNTFSPGITTTYTVTGTSGSCSNTASVTVTVHDLPNVSLIAGDDELCQGESTSLTASGANTYLWSNSGSGNPINVSPGTTTTYTVTGTDGNSCSSSASVTITVYDSPDVTLSASQTTICEGDSVVLTAGGADTYAWLPSGTGTENTYYPVTTTTYIVTGTNSYNCSASASVTVTVSQPADATIITTGPFCSADDQVVLNAVTSGGTWAGTGITNSGSGIFDPGIAGTGLHTIIYTISGTCGDSDTIEILVHESPDISISATPISCDGASDGLLLLSIDGGLPPYSISWNNGSNDTLLSNLASGNYSVVVTDGNSCSVTSGFNLDDPGIPCDTYIPHVVIPNVFSPNGDGQNDVLYVRGEGISRLDFVIYTRWGEKVFETTSKDIGWDGTFEGKDLDPAVFVYYLRATLINYEEVNLSGDITLIR